MLLLLLFLFLLLLVLLFSLHLYQRNCLGQRCTLRGIRDGYWVDIMFRFKRTGENVKIKCVVLKNSITYKEIKWVLYCKQMTIKLKRKRKLWMKIEGKKTTVRVDKICWTKLKKKNSQKDYYGNYRDGISPNFSKTKDDQTKMRCKCDSWLWHDMVIIIILHVKRTMLYLK